MKELEIKVGSYYAYVRKIAPNNAIEIYQYRGLNDDNNHEWLGFESISVFEPVERAEAFAKIFNQPIMILEVDEERALLLWDKKEDLKQIEAEVELKKNLGELLSTQYQPVMDLVNKAWEPLGNRAFKIASSLVAEWGKELALNEK